MAAPVGALFIELRAGMARFWRDMQTATKPLRNFGKQAERLVAQWEPNPVACEEIAAQADN